MCSPGKNSLVSIASQPTGALKWVLNLVLFISVSLQTRCPALENGPKINSPNCCKCGCRFSWTSGTSCPKSCEFAERPVTAEPFTTAWIMRQRPRSSVYNLEAERVNLNPGTAQTDLPVPTKGGRKSKLPLGMSPVVQQLRLHAPKAGGPGFNYWSGN